MNTLIRMLSVIAVLCAIFFGVRSYGSEVPRPSRQPEIEWACEVPAKSPVFPTHIDACDFVSIQWERPSVFPRDPAPRYANPQPAHC